MIGSFLSTLLPLGCLHLFHYVLLSFMLVSFVLSSPSCLGRGSQTVLSAFSLATPVTPFMLEYNFTSSMITFWSFAALYLFWALRLLIIYFCKMSCGFITRRQGDKTTIHFAECELSNRCTGTNHEQSLKDDIIGRWSCCRSVFTQ